ncbi:hypothetical protein E4U47_007446 [Claviceps purpurea]|nr:hypothetical protein E4U47_007446 [Claviceps purpurea]
MGTGWDFLEYHLSEDGWNAKIIPYDDEELYDDDIGSSPSASHYFLSVPNDIPRGLTHYFKALTDLLSRRLAQDVVVVLRRDAEPLLRHAASRMTDLDDLSTHCMELRSVQ